MSFKRIAPPPPPPLRKKKEETETCTMKSKADSVFAQRRMRILLEMLCGQQGKEINALLAAEPREGALRRAYQKIDDAIAEAIVEESKIIASALQEKRQAL